jgi:hypothetical protein
MRGMLEPKLRLEATGGSSGNGTPRRSQYSRMRMRRTWLGITKRTGRALPVSGEVLWDSNHISIESRS